MDQRNIDFIKDIISEEDSKLLHTIAENYNWYDGFELPELIINNTNCELATALLIFYDADGYSYLENLLIKESIRGQQNFNFIDKLYKRILADEFMKGSISYVPDLTKVQIYKFKKVNPDIKDLFYYGV